MKIVIIPVLICLCFCTSVNATDANDTSGKQVRVVLQTGLSGQASAFFSQNDEHFFTYSENGEIIEWETATLRQLRNYLGHEGPLQKSWLENNNILTVSNSRIFFWTPGEPQLQKSLQLFDSTGEFISLFAGRYYDKNGSLLIRQDITPAGENVSHPVLWKINVAAKSCSRVDISLLEEAAEGKNDNEEDKSIPDATIIVNKRLQQQLVLKKDQVILEDLQGSGIRKADFLVAVPDRIIPSNSSDGFIIVTGGYRPRYWFWRLANSFPEAQYDPQSPLIDSSLLIRLADTSGTLKYKVEMSSDWKMSYFRGLQSITLTDQEGKLITLSGHTGDLQHWCIDSSQRWLASCSRAEYNSHYFNEIKIWNIEKAYEYKRMLDVEEKTEVDALRFSADGKYLYGSYKNSMLVKWEIKTGVVEQQWDLFAPFTFTGKDSLLAGAANLGQDIKVYEPKSGKLVYTLKGHSAPLADLRFIAGGRYLLSAARDGKLIIWDMKDGSRVYDIIQLRDGFSYLLMTDQNYYLGSREAMNELNFIWNDKAWSYEPFDLTLNRPDLVLGKIGQAGSGDLLPVLRQAWGKRVLRSGQTPEQAAKFPDLEQLPAAEIVEQKIDNFRLYLKTKYSSKAGLLDYQVRINGVPAYSQGRGIIAAAGNSIEVMDTLDLLEQINIVQLYCRDKLKRESPRKTLFFQLPEVERRDRRIFVGIGVSDYKESEYHLRYPAKDVADLSGSFLREKRYDTAVLLTNEKACRDSIVALKKFLSSLRPMDELVISFNGHGVVDSALNFYFAPYDMVFADPAKKGLSYDAITDLLRSSPARKKLCLIDACHSGALDKEEKYTIIKDSLVVAGQRGVVVTSSATTSSTGMSSFKLMQYLFTDLADNDGSIILSAAGGDEVAFEGDEWNNGAFTYCIRNGLEKKEADLDSDGQVTVSELKNYISRWVQAVTGGRQQPMVRQDNIRLQWVLAGLQ